MAMSPMRSNPKAMLRERRRSDSSISPDRLRGASEFGMFMLSNPGPSVCAANDQFRGQGPFLRTRSDEDKLHRFRRRRP